MPIHEAEELVRRLQDVSGCRIQLDLEGRPVAVHVTLFGARPPAQVIAEIVTLLAAEAGLDVLPGQVHVVTVPPASTAAAPTAVGETVGEPADPVLEELEEEARPRLLAMNLMVSEERSLAEVELAQGTLSALGRAEAHGGGSAPELMAQACLDALEKLCGARVALRLVACQRLRLGAVEVFCVLVQETEGRDERLHVGAASVDADVSRAAAYAALDSLNRRLGRIQVGPPIQYHISARP